VSQDIRGPCSVTLKSKFQATLGPLNEVCRKKKYGGRDHDQYLAPFPASPVFPSSSSLTHLFDNPANCAHRKGKNRWKETTAKEEIERKTKGYRKKENES